MNRETNVHLLPARGMSAVLFPPPKTILCMFLALMLVTIPLWAGLGQPEASVTADQQRMKSEDHVQTFQSFRVHELTRENTTVREYVSPQGLVFGLAWQGRSMPDVNQLLGNYVNELQTATPAQTRIQPRRGITVKTDDFVYSNFCHMRNCVGRTYVPSLVPSNVSAEVVR